MTTAKSKPLKLQSPDQGDLKRLSTSEENYLAYLVGNDHISDTSASPNIGNLTLTSSGNSNVGSFVDTYFNQAVGTHPASSITSGSTTTTLYQKSGVVTETSNFRRPVAYFKPPTDGSGNEGVYEMADSDLNLFVDRLNGRIAQSDYNSAYRLGTTSPGAGWNTYMSNVFSDTITGSTVNNYNIYRYEGQAVPTIITDSDGVATTLCAIKRSGGVFEGIERMDSAEVLHTLSSRALTRKAVSGNVGSMQLRSSSQGAPTGGGTWRAIGTATNTKRTTTETSYTRTRTSAYTRVSNRAFTRVSTRTSTRNFAGNYTGNYTGDYTRDFEGNYSRTSVGGNFAGNYLGDYTRTSLGNYSRNFNRTIVGNYQGNFTSDEIGSGTETIETYTLYVRTA